jgi:spermidine synthase
MSREPAARKTALDFKVRRTKRGELVLESGDFDHSVLPPPGKLTGGVWDALAATPLLLAERALPLRILLLGVGGGSVLHLWDRVLPSWTWTGVERDARARKLFREAFGLPRAPGELVAGDALDYVRTAKRRWDLVVDDLFDESFRPTLDQPGWLLRLRRCVARGGALVTNLVWDDGRTGANRAYRERLLAAFPHHVQITCDDSENRVLVSSESALLSRGLGARFAARTGVADAWKGFRARSLRGKT